MERRAFVSALAVGIVVQPYAATAQQPRKLPWVVWPGISPLESGESVIQDPFHDGFRDLGYVEGKDIVVEYRQVDRRPERLPELIDWPIQQKVDVLFASRPDVVLMAMRATRSIPIVFMAITDPVGAGIVESLARPGGNVTGVAWDSSPTIAAKQLQLVHELRPGSRTIAVLWNPEVRGSLAFVQEMQKSAGAAAIALRLFEVRRPADFDAAFAGMSAANAMGVVILGSDFTWTHREALANLAAKHRLPAIYGNRDSVLAGGLMSYGANLPDQFRRAATYIHKILKGAKPADLPVEQPTKFEFVVNLKTAKALGLTIPQALLLRAEEVIQ